MACIWKTAGHRANQTEIMESPLVMTCIRGKFDLFKVVLGSFGTPTCLKIACSSKTKGCRAKRCEISGVMWWGGGIESGL